MYKLTYRFTFVVRSSLLLRFLIIFQAIQMSQEIREATVTYKQLVEDKNKISESAWMSSVLNYLRSVLKTWRFLFYDFLIILWLHFKVFWCLKPLDATLISLLIPFSPYVNGRGYRISSPRGVRTWGLRASFLAVRFSEQISPINLWNLSKPLL